MTFEQWLHEVDLICEAWYGISIHDLPDMCFRDAFDAGDDPEEFMLAELGDLEALAQLVLS